MTDLSIIIVTYNSADHIQGLLDSIQKSKDNLTKEVIVIDNASQDNSAATVKNHPLKVNLIAQKTNPGFSKSVNLGLRQATGQYLLLLNPDTVLVGDCLTKLVQFARNKPNLGAVAPALLHPDGKPQASIFHFPTILNAIKHDFFNQKTAFGKYLPTTRTDPEVVEIAMMAAFLIPHSTYEKVGGLDERFFLYYEDIEYCRRLKQNQLPIYYLPTAKVKHVHGASGKFKSHQTSPLLASSQIYYGQPYASLLNAVLWLGHKWQVVLRRKRFHD